MRVVFDTNTLISALLFKGQTNALVELWKNQKLSVLASNHTVAEFSRVLNYPKFKLSETQIQRIANAYLPYAKMIQIKNQQALTNIPQCRDTKDQIFLELAWTGKADILVTGDEDLLILNELFSFEIETPSVFLQRNLDSLSK